MDEMLSMALWIMVVFMTISATITWFGSQTDFPTQLGLIGLGSNTLLIPGTYVNVSCEMTSLFEAPGYAWCFLGKITSPILGMVDAIWKLLTSWTNLLNAIFVNIPAGSLFAGLLIPFLGIIEIGAVIVILMRLSAIIRGVAGGFL
jgi:hypothetical protein